MVLMMFFPLPMEVELLRKTPKIGKNLEIISKNKLNSYLNSSQPDRLSLEAFKKLSLLPLSHVLVPKKEAFDFRKIAIIRPEDLAVYQTIAIMIAEPFEKIRSDVARGRIFSHRFMPNLKRGQLFSPAHNVRSFQSTSTRISKQKSVQYLVRSDIANFYNRINIHRVESTLRSMGGLDKKIILLINQILLHWAKRDSYGLPIGSNGSRVIAEIALYNVDRSLKEAGFKFIRFADDYRIFAKTAAEAHSALAMLIELLDREGLFINTQKTSIDRLVKATSNETVDHKEEAQTERTMKEFRIFAGYGGTIPTKFRTPTKHSKTKYSGLDLDQAIAKIESEGFVKPDQLRDVLYGIISQEKYRYLLKACDLVGMFPQFYPLLVDILTKYAENIPQNLRRRIVMKFSGRLKNNDFLPEFFEASLIRLIGHNDFFERDTIMYVIRNLRRNAGTYLGRVAFDATQNLSDRSDALEVREYFHRSDEWERRRIIQLMLKILPSPEYAAWRRSIRTYVSDDPFASAIE